MECSDSLAPSWATPQPPRDSGTLARAFTLKKGGIIAHVWVPSPSKLDDDRRLFYACNEPPGAVLYDS